MIDYFIICHDPNIILDQINSKKYKQLPDYKFLFVGDKNYQSIEHLSNVIICRNLPNNIEQDSALLSFTAWYAISNNCLSNSEYICVLEYDVDLNDDFHQKNIDNKGVDICAYFKEKINSLQFTRSNPWTDILIRQMFNGLTVDKFSSKYSIWYPTTNFLFKKTILEDFNKWFYAKIYNFKDQKYVSYAQERMVTIYANMHQYKVKIENSLSHNQARSHGVKDIFQKAKDTSIDIEKIYLKELRDAAWEIPIEEHFDEKFYYENYEDVRGWYAADEFISLKQRMFHHYFLYGKNEGRFKNQKEKHKHTACNILDYISLNDIQYFPNELECICLLVTDKEISNGLYNKFITMLISNTEPLSLYKTIDFCIIANNLSDNSIEQINKHNPKHIFKNIKIINLNIDPSEDLYIKNHDEQISIPKYGLKSGPNIVFFKTIAICQQYNTTLLLETDCILSPNWLSKLIYYTKYANGFLISGAMYDGLLPAKSDSQIKTHINGGTALYATGNKILQQVVSILSKYMEKQIADNMPGLAYDYALKLLIDNNLDLAANTPKKKEVWQFIHRNYLHCKAIINCSPDSDSFMDPNKIYSRYEYAILHKKSKKN